MGRYIVAHHTNFLIVFPAYACSFTNTRTLLESTSLYPLVKWVGFDISPNIFASLPVIFCAIKKLENYSQKLFFIHNNQSSQAYLQSVETNLQIVIIFMSTQLGVLTDYYLFLESEDTTPSLVTVINFF